MTEPRTSVRVDGGQIKEAVLILAEDTTLAQHVKVTSLEHGALIETDPDGVPYALWGSGTQALWRLLCSIAYPFDEVSLYEVLSRLDRPNTAAVADALAALCREPVSDPWRRTR